ncbi:MAG: hypothetical protein R3351_09490, partial [Nitrospirales bacterium]|nr:hypothetical protein [Nitrospirales bacterium]
NDDTNAQLASLMAWEYGLLKYAFNKESFARNRVADLFHRGATEDGQRLANDARNLRHSKPGYSY